jgi:hypothetical protein
MRFVVCQWGLQNSASPWYFRLLRGTTQHSFSALAGIRFSASITGTKDLPPPGVTERMISRIGFPDSISRQASMVSL